MRKSAVLQSVYVESGEVVPFRGHVPNQRAMEAAAFGDRLEVEVILGDARELGFGAAVVTGSRSTNALVQGMGAVVFTDGAAGHAGGLVEGAGCGVEVAELPRGLDVDLGEGGKDIVLQIGGLGVDGTGVVLAVQHNSDFVGSAGGRFGALVFRDFVEAGVQAIAVQGEVDAVHHEVLLGAPHVLVGLRLAGSTMNLP